MRRRLIRKLDGATRFVNTMRHWVRLGGRIDVLRPMVSEFNEGAGVVGGHYFHQDLVVAKLIHEHNPVRHVDIGSRIDGFVAHVASFRKIEIIDIRELEDSVHTNIVFTRADLMHPLDLGVVDSLSCLHALEHFGLGRYGDPVDPHGHESGLSNMVNAVASGGRFYVSFPISFNPRVEFNAHRVLHPEWILEQTCVSQSLKLVRFDFINDRGQLTHNTTIGDLPQNLRYGCGVYTFEKI